MIALGLLTDGRADYLARTVETLDNFAGVDRKFMVNDSGDADYTAWLRQEFRTWTVFHNQDRLGLAGAVQRVWDVALDSGCDHFLHMEDDFLIREPIDLAPVAGILDAHQDVAQMLFKRQPLSAREFECGGDVLGAMGALESHDGWVSQRHIFSLNPCLIPRWVLAFGWPEGNEAEQTQRLVRKGFRFGVWGGLGVPPVVEHIGVSRSGGWKL